MTPAIASLKCRCAQAVSSCSIRWPARVTTEDRVVERAVGVPLARAATATCACRFDRGVPGCALCAASAIKRRFVAWKHRASKQTIRRSSTRHHLRGHGFGISGARLSGSPRGHFAGQPDQWPEPRCHRHPHSKASKAEKTKRP